MQIGSLTCDLRMQAGIIPPRYYLQRLPILHEAIVLHCKAALCSQALGAMRAQHSLKT